MGHSQRDQKVVFKRGGLFSEVVVRWVSTVFYFNHDALFHT